MIPIAITGSNFLLGVLVLGPLVFIAASAVRTRRIAGQSDHLKSRAARLRVWGGVPRQFGESPLFVKRVWMLGAGLHLDVSTGDGTRTVHIKVAQPRGCSIDEQSLIINDAKYIQISGAAVERVPGRVAMELLLEPLKPN